MSYICPFCDAPATIRDSVVVYGTSYGLALICTRFPKCDAYVGCHRGTSTPLGTMADKALREARRKAHAAFDPLWQRGGPLRRPEAYEWLSRALGITRFACHIALFDSDRCARTVAACTAFTTKAPNGTAQVHPRRS